MNIAVLLSAYNGEKFIEEQIESILAQEVDAQLQIIVRDDGSTDRTEQILKNYAEKGQLQYYKGKNIGAARSFISLLRDTVGYDFYAFADQDDVWYPKKLQNALDAIMHVSGPVLYCSNSELVDEKLNFLGRYTYRKLPSFSLVSVLCLASSAQGSTSVFNEALARAVRENEIPETFVMHDTMLTCLCKLIDGVVIYDERPSMKYRMHGGNVFGIVSSRQGVIKVIRERIREATQKKTIGMYEQTESLLRTYANIIPEDNKSICETVINSKNSILARLKLVFDKNLRHVTLNKTITKKLEILLGND